MTTEEIARRLVDYCRKGDWQGAHVNLYAENARSIEQAASPDFEREVTGISAIRDKAARFDASIKTTHSIDVGAPIIAGNAFALTITMDVTMNGKGRTKFSELCVYQLKDGKIISEQFFG